jgi:hypothetical protein
LTRQILGERQTLGECDGMGLGGRRETTQFKILLTALGVAEM